MCPISRIVPGGSAPTAAPRNDNDRAPQNPTYVVKSGDTLWGIAQQYLGNGSRHPEIAKLNNLSGDTISVGMQLVLPPDARLPAPAPVAPAPQQSPADGTSSFEGSVPGTPAPATTVPGATPVGEVLSTPGITDRLVVKPGPDGHLSLSLSGQLTSGSELLANVRLRLVNTRTGEQTDLLLDYRGLAKQPTWNGASAPAEVELPGLPGDEFRVLVSQPFSDPSILTDVNTPQMLASFRQVGYVESASGAPAPAGGEGQVARPPVLWLPSIRHQARPPGATIDAIVLHDTTGGQDVDAVRAAKYFTGPAVNSVTGEQCLPPSAHFTVGRDGTIVQSVRESEWASHAGQGSTFDGRGNVDDFSIGIEIVNASNGTDPYTDAQYRALAQLVAYLQQEYGIPWERITGHRDVVTYKSDPASNFSYERLRQEVQRVLSGQ